MADIASSELEQKFLDNPQDVVDFKAGSQTYSLNFECKFVKWISFHTFKMLKQFLRPSCSRRRYATDKQAVRHEEECEKTTSVCLCRRCQNNHSEVRMSYVGAIFKKNLDKCKQ